MPRKRDVIDRARKILGGYEAAVEQLKSAPADLAPLLGRTKATGGLESLPIDDTPDIPPAGTARMGSAGQLTLEAAVDRERAAVVAEGLEAMKKIEAGRDDITPREQAGLEAIVLLTGRPALLIQNGDFLEPPKKWAILKTVRDDIKRVIERVGRIEVSGNPNFDWLGTGFLAGRDIAVTNRHVAIEFSRGSGSNWTFRGAMGASIDFREELGGEDSFEFQVVGIVGIHEEHDLALLRLEQASDRGALPEPLPICGEAPAGLVGRQVYVIGYPAWDGRRNDPEPMLRIFSNIFNVKRLHPGEISGEAVTAFEIFHDCSTLGGNSGSPVVDLDTHAVIGLHFGGRYLERNHAVPLWTLKHDPLVRRANLNFL